MPEHKGSNYGIIPLLNILKMEPVKTKKYTYFIGIDVSKNELDYAVITDNKLLFHREAVNHPSDIVAFVTELKTLPKFTMSKAIFCMEHTGIYCNHLLGSLKKLKANIALENGLQIRNSLGVIRGKYDKIDAIRIAQYAVKNKEELKLWIPRRPVCMQLASLFTLRNRIVTLQMSLRAPLLEEIAFVKKGIIEQNTKLCSSSINAMKADLEEIEQTIDLLIASDENLRRICHQIISIPNVGRITAIQMIISTNEFKDISNPKKFACYAGVAPFIKESGLFRGKAKVSPIANKKVKALLHICALNAVRHDEEIKAYYERKTQVEGKAKMLVLNAVKYKLILRIFACVNQNRIFEVDYVRIKEITASESGTTLSLETHDVK